MTLLYEEGAAALDRASSECAPGDSRNPDHEDGSTYQFRFPLSIVKTCGRGVRVAGFTLAMSSRRLLFVCDRRANLGDVLEYVILMPGKRDQEPVRLRSTGTVLRAEAWDDGGRPNGFKWRITATIETYRFEREQGPTNKGRSRPSLPSQRISRREIRLAPSTDPTDQLPLLSSGTR